MTVNISVTKNELKFIVMHNGKGISNDDFTQFADKSEGLGMSSLKSRTTLLNAALDFQVGENAMVIFTVPLEYEKND